jgi:hypothetical protein
MKKNTENQEADANGVGVETIVSPAIFKAMWPNQPVNVCAKHAQAITNIGQAIGLQVPLLSLLGDEECINCQNEAKQG